MNLIEITTNEFDVTINLAYAKSSNFTGEKIYKNSRCYLHKDAINNLTNAINIAKGLGYKLKIYDAFRPSEAQEKLWNFNPDPQFISHPQKGSPHSRGVALDVTLLKNNKNLDMGTPFDSFSEKSFHGNNNIGAQAKKNRMILLAIMTLAGWDYYKNEWWHYQLFNSKNWPILSDKSERTNLI